MTVYLLNPNSSHETTEAMTAIARNEAPGLSITGLTAPFGPSMIVDEAGLGTGARAVEAMARGLTETGDVDAIIVAAFGDPGIAAVRAGLPGLPATGIGEASFAEAARDGQRFAVVTTTPELVAAIAERVRLAGHSDRFLGTVLTEGDPEALLTSCEALEAALEEACRRARDDLAAEVIIIGGGPLAEAADALGRRLSIPIVAPVRAAARRIVETLSGRGDGGKSG
ncbi:aspartate/glutamate racemase family protein [Jiella pelagia]|uniref:Aspartate/glutamate racemase family protein n=1 Tax=Jiella pelagia TaxID=2986949 RepID=A0ABY7BZ94_9HYPH|nr:aspartate/glutamate racemase family protein [Jiella pelagia]WAP68301.1 aspartate/glutamate racemase family protein [Jiella pelagia]